MSDRVIRDELLTSGRYWSVSIEARELFIHLLLNADDTARFSGNNYTIRAACYPGQAVDAEKLEGLLSSLHDADLIRLYTAGGMRFIFIPRFRQRLRFVKSKYPAPPKEISDMPEEKPDSGQSLDVQQSDSRPQKRSEVKRSEVSPPSPPSGGAVASQEKAKTNGQWWLTEAETLAKALEIGVIPRPGEDWGPLRTRIRAAIAKKEHA